MTDDRGVQLTGVLPESRDVLELVDLSYRYARAIDTEDWDLFNSLFTEKCVVDYGIKPVHGREAFLLISRRTVESLDATHHVFTNHEYSVDGDQAVGRFYMTAQHIKRDHPNGALYTLGGVYDDQMVRTSTGWKIHNRLYRAIWGAGNAALLGSRFLSDSSQSL